MKQTFATRPFVEVTFHATWTHFVWKNVPFGAPAISHKRVLRAARLPRKMAAPAAAAAATPIAAAAAATTTTTTATTSSRLAYY